MKIFEYLTYSYILYKYNIYIISIKFEINLKMYKCIKNELFKYSAKCFNKYFITFYAYF